MYLVTLIIGHTSCNMLSILKKLTLQKKLHNFGTQNVLMGQKRNKYNNIESNTKTMSEPGIEPGTSCTHSGCVTSVPRSQLRVTIVVKLFNYFDAMGRNLNKQGEFAGQKCVFGQKK